MMNIPKSSIEPFGVIGIPRIKNHTSELLKDIRRRINAINSSSLADIQPILSTALDGWYNKK